MANDAFAETRLPLWLANVDDYILQYLSWDESEQWAARIVESFRPAADATQICEAWIRAMLFGSDGALAALAKKVGVGGSIEASQSLTSVKHDAPLADVREELESATAAVMRVANRSLSPHWAELRSNATAAGTSGQSLSWGVMAAAGFLDGRPDTAGGPGQCAASAAALTSADLVLSKLVSCMHAAR